MVENRVESIFKSGAEIIAHQVNCVGVMGNTIGTKFRYKYKNIYADYRAQCREFGFSDVLLGTFLFISGEGRGSIKNQLIANLFTKYAPPEGKNENTIDYPSLRRALKHLKYTCDVTAFATREGVWNIAIPYGMGCGSSGGDWEIIDAIIHEVFDESEHTHVVICKVEEEE